MLTKRHKKPLAKAVKEEISHYVQWRNWDEIKPK
jgi:predicted SprT family Zn-dependent metalloprotease